MVKLRFVWFLCVAALVVVGCTRSGSGKTHGNKSGNVPPLVALCDSLDYADTAAIHDETFMAELMTSVVMLMPQTDSVAVRRALSTFFNGLKGDEKAMQTVARLANLYLADPASPVRNEALYIQFLRSMLSTDSLPETVSSRSKEELRVALMNCPGTIATDFEFVDRDGNRMSLHDLIAGQTLLIFYDPECTHCSDILAVIAEASNINSAIQSGDLTVLAIYAEGNRKLWEKTAGDMPSNWKVGCDVTGILDNDLYDLPAMPIIYLLDFDKRVILKDADVRSLCR